MSADQAFADEAALVYKASPVYSRTGLLPTLPLDLICLILHLNNRHYSIGRRELEVGQSLDLLLHAFEAQVA